MDTTGGAPYPQAPAVQGAILPAASQLINPRSIAAHRFLHVIRDLVRHSGAYVNEQALLDAVAIVDEYAKHLIDPADRHRVKTEDEHAPVEDARLRSGPNAVPLAPQGMVIDYNQLAQAILMAQQAQAQAQVDAEAQAQVPPQQTVHTITDAAPPASHGYAE